MAATNPTRTCVLLLTLVVLLVYVVWRGGLPGLAPRAAAQVEDEVSLSARLQALQGLPQILLDRPARQAAYNGERNLCDYTETPEVRRERAQARARRETGSQQR